jgi:hypothetical protein
MRLACLFVCLHVQLLLTCSSAAALSIQSRHIPAQRWRQQQQQCCDACLLLPACFDDALLCTARQSWPKFDAWQDNQYGISSTYKYVVITATRLVSAFAVAHNHMHVCFAAYQFALPKLLLWFCDSSRRLQVVVTKLIPARNLLPVEQATVALKLNRVKGCQPAATIAGGRLRLSA